MSKKHINFKIYNQICLFLYTITLRIHILKKIYIKLNFPKSATYKIKKIIYCTHRTQQQTNYLLKKYSFLAKCPFRNMFLSVLMSVFKYHSCMYGLVNGCKSTKSSLNIIFIKHHGSQNEKHFLFNGKLLKFK